MKLTSISLIVPDYDLAIDHYCRVMGFALLKDQDQGRKRWVEVAPDGGGVSFVLARADTPEQVAAIGNQGAGRVWLFLRTEDFDMDFKRLSSAGIQFEDPPRREPYGTVAVFRDGFGNRWDLIEPAKEPE